MAQINSRWISSDLRISQKIIYQLSRQFHFISNIRSDVKYCFENSCSDPTVNTLSRRFYKSNKMRADIRNNLDNTARFYDQSVKDYCNREHTKLSIESVIDFWSAPRTMLQKQRESSNLLLSELPIRLAHRINDLEQLPFMIACNKYIQAIHNIYIYSFDVLRKYPTIRTREDIICFSEQLKKLFASHADVVPNLARALRDCREYCPSQTTNLTEFLDRMLIRRISTRVLAGQHLACMDQYPVANDITFPDLSLTNVRELGLIDRQCPLKEVIMDVGQSVQKACNGHYGMYPNIQTKGRLDITFPYIRSHLEYVLAEILKNSMRATIEFNSEKMEKKRIAGDKEYNISPPVVITMSQSPEEVCIKISDQGGGIAHDKLPKIWEYGFSTAEFPDHFISSRRNKPAPMCGYGLGLPLSRIYARYFGGDLQVNSMDGYGTDIYLKLRHINETKKK